MFSIAIEDIAASGVVGHVSKGLVAGSEFILVVYNLYIEKPAKKNNNDNSENGNNGILSIRKMFVHFLLNNFTASLNTKVHTCQLKAINIIYFLLAEKKNWLMKISISVNKALDNDLKKVEKKLEKRKASR